MPAFQREHSSRRGRRKGLPGDDVMEMLQTIGGLPPARARDDIHALVESMAYERLLHESLSSNRTSGSSRGSTASPELHPRQQRLPNRPSPQHQQHQQRSTRSKKKKKAWRNSEASRRPNVDAPRQPNSQSYNARRSGKNRGKRYNENKYNSSQSPPGKQNRKNYRKSNFRGRGAGSNGADSVNWRRRDDAEALQLPHPRAQRRDLSQYSRGEDTGRKSRNSTLGGGK